MPPVTISRATARRFVLGRQGLWPGRRFAGLEGTAAALRLAQAVQMDPLNVVARSHDLTLWGRVLDYRPAQLERLMYHAREFFDYGGALFIYPMEELPYWRLPMRRRAREPRWAAFADAHRPLLDTLRAVLRERGPLGNRDLPGTRRIQSYRGRKDSALGLYYLWLTGEVMIHHRRGFDRVYDLLERVAPPALQHVASDAQAEAFFARKAVDFLGLVAARAWRNGFMDAVQRPVEAEEARRRLDEMLEQRALAEVAVEGTSEPLMALAQDLPLLEVIESGRAPQAWAPAETSTSEEVVFLAPLEIVSARGRARRLFDFEYVWEVYKPAAARRWGYYMLPMLYDDRLVGRLDPRLERGRGELQILGFWLEPGAPEREPAFAAALARALARLARFLEAGSVDVGALRPLRLRRAVAQALRANVRVRA